MSLTSQQVPVLRSDAEALSVARELAAVLKRDSALRDRERRLPHDELELFSRTGLWGISVPKAFGGAGVSNTTLANVIAVIAAADGVPAAWVHCGNGAADLIFRVAQA